MNETSSNAALAGAIAAAGLMAAPAAALGPIGDDGLSISDRAMTVGSETGMIAKTVDETIRSALSGETQESVEQVDLARFSNSAGNAMSDSPEANALAGDGSTTPSTPAELLHGTERVAQSSLAEDVSLVADSVAMPSADMLQALRPVGADVAKPIGEVGRVLADSLSGDGRGARALDALLDALPGHAHGEMAGIAAIANHAFTDLGLSAGGHSGMLGSAHFAFAAEALAVHHDAPPLT